MRFMHNIEPFLRAAFSLTDQPAYPVDQYFGTGTRQVLGAVLIDNRVIEELSTPLRPDHFFIAGNSHLGNGVFPGYRP